MPRQTWYRVGWVQPSVLDVAVRGVMGYQRTLAASLACLDIRGCASSVALVLAMRCTWSLSVQRWQICVANFRIFFSHIRRCSNSCGSQICCRLPSS